MLSSSVWSAALDEMTPAASLRPTLILRLAPSNPLVPEETAPLVIRAFSSSSAPVRDIAFVDGSLSDYQTLVDGLSPNTAVYVLNPAGDELSQISQVLASYSNLASVAVFSHGSDGALQFGSTSLNTSNLLDYAGILQSWAGSFSEDGDLLLYGCDLAADATGQSFVSQIAALTGADVAASTDLTGSSALGGDWDLEFSTGSIEASDFLSDWAQAAYQNVLETVTTGSTGGGQAFSNLQPYATHNYIIALQGIFPSRDLSSGPFLGAVEEFAGNFEPRGWAFADGRLLPINQNQALFAILGNTYGGDGRTTFALPDLRGRIPVGTGNGITLGQQIGTETVTLTEANLPAHSHTTSILGVPTTETTGGGQPFGNWQPSLGLTPLIATQGIFPSRNLSDGDVIGSVSWFAGNFAPRGYALANGELLPISSNTALFSLLGTTYGGDGRTNFALPDLRGRTPIHAGQGQGLSNIALGEMGGTTTVTLTQSNLPAHSHTISGQAVSGTTGSGQPFDNRQPFLALNYQISQFGIFPTQNLDAGSDSTNPTGTNSGASGLVDGRKVLSDDIALQKINTLAQVAIRRWISAGISAEQTAQLEAITYKIANLDPGSLAFAGTDNVVTIDTDASNRGWFIDQTPEDNVEFGTTDPVTGELYATEPDAAGHFDLLTAIMHEQGHILGLAHAPQRGSLMYGALGVGGRLFPTLTDLVASSPSDTESSFLAADTPFIGSIGMFAGNFEIRGFNFTDGQTLFINDNEDLFRVIGTTYGGDGQTTFALPDFRGRVAVGRGQGPGTSNYSLGQRDGTETTSLTINQMPSHTHTFEIQPNTPPTTANKTVTTLEDKSYTFVATDFGFSDPDAGDSLKAIEIQAAPANGILKLNGTALNFSNGPVTVTAATIANLTFEPAANANGPSYAAFGFKVLDQADAKSDTKTLTIDVTPVNDAPSFTIGVNQTVLEDAGAQTITNWAMGISAGPTDEAGQTLNFNVSNNNNALFSVQPTIDSTGKLTYTPAANANGTATVTVQLQDNSGTDNGGFDASAPQTFTINVTPVNDAPIRIAGSVNNLTVNQNSGTTSLGLSGVSYGPGGGSNETSQTLTYVVTAIPASSLGTVYLANGTTAVTANTTYTLTQIQGMKFTTAPNANGSGTFTFTVKDSGGIANGGVDTLTQSIALRVVRDLGTLGKSAGTLKGTVSNADPFDYYQFTLNGLTNKFRATLAGLKANADITIYQLNGDGTLTEVASSKKTGTQEEVISNQQLGSSTPVTYLIEVKWVDGVSSTPYNLSFSA